MQEAINGREKEAWKSLVKSEIVNFLKRGSWKKASGEEAKSKGRKIIPSKWVFKIIHELNNTV